MHLCQKDYDLFVQNVLGHICNLFPLKLANTEKNIILEGDAKTCFDFLNSKSFIGWNVFNILNNVLEIGFSFLFCAFNWVRREANGVAHALAKFVSPLRDLLCVVPLPPFQDQSRLAGIMMFLFHFSNEVIQQQKKKPCFPSICFSFYYLYKN